MALSMRCFALILATVFLPVLAVPETCSSATQPLECTKHHVEASADISLLQESMKPVQQASLAREKRNIPERLEAWEGLGLEHISMLSGSQLDELRGAITAVDYGRQLHDITDPIGSRFVADGGNAETASRIASQFAELGLTVWTEPLNTAGVLSRYVPSSGANLVAGVLGRLNGTDLPDEAVLIGAHFDSVNWDDTSRLAPGVDDNGSGIALMLLIANALAHSDIRLRRSVIFAAFNAEEEGLIGSRQIAPLVADGKYGNVKSVIIADEVAYPGASNTPSRQAIFETRGTVNGTEALLDTFAQSVRTHPGDGVDGFLVNRHGFASDHISFLEKGYPTVLLIEGDNVRHADEWGHSARDTFEHVDFEFGAAMTRLALSVAATLATPVD